MDIINRNEMGRLHKNVLGYVEDLIDAHDEALQAAHYWKERAEEAEKQRDEHEATIDEMEETLRDLQARVTELEAALAAGGDK